MKFLELSFPAFGPFTNFSLRLTSEVGLSVIYGPNESGKSSALRAVRGLLYGIPADGRDEFLHPGSGLRVRALLEDARGERLCVTRRKGRKKTLLDEQGQAYEEDVLGPYLGGVDAALFDRLYGLDHRTLSLGGKALLEDGGKVGESLFAAGLGPGFREVRERLSQERDMLWKPRSKTLEIDKTIDSYRAAQKRAIELSASAESWRKISHELAQEREREGDLAQQFAELGQQRQRLTRQLDAHKPLLTRRHLQSELLALGQLPQLTADFSERRQSLQSDLAALRQMVEQAAARRQSLEKRLAALPAQPRLLDSAARIDQLNRSLDAVAKAQAEYGPTQAKLEMLSQAIAGAAADLGFDLQDKKLPEAASRERARRLAGVYRDLLSEQTGLQAQLRAWSEQLSELRERRLALGAIPSTRELETSLQSLRRCLGEDNEVSHLEETLVSKTESLELALSSLPFWSGELSELSQMTLPSEQRVLEFERRQSELQERIKSLRKELRQIEERGKRAKSQLNFLSEHHQVTTRDQLLAARAQRDESWEKACQGGWSEELRQQVKAEIDRTDVLTDRMLADAARVSEADLLAREYKLCRDEWPEQSKKVEEALAELDELRQSWSACWDAEGLELGSPGEMRGWLARREGVLTIEAEVRGLRTRLEGARRRRAGLLAEQAEVWSSHLGSAGLGTTVAEAVERAEAALNPLLKVAEEQRQLSGQEEVLQRQLDGARSALEEKASALEDWRSEWAEVAAVFGHPVDTDPRDLEGLLRRYEDLRKQVEERERCERELEGHKLVLEGFRQQVAELSRQLGEAVEEKDSAVYLERLVAELREERAIFSQRESLSQELEQIARECEEKTRKLTQHEAAWKELLAEAGGVAEGQLAELESKVARRTQVVERIADLEETLLPLAAGQGLEEFADSLEGVAWDAVPGEIAELTHRIQALEQERRNAWRRTGELEQELRSFDGAEEAAAAAQEAAEVMAEGKAMVARYARLALAEAVLQREIERYRRENEGPVLRAASDWFARLTRTAYQGLSTGVDPRTGTPRLEAVSASGRQIPVEGLSDGTRDQLFMALRLATIAFSQERAEPMPLILDDVLVHFDTERAQATLEVLAEFAQTTQVLLFTHLERDRALASSLTSHPVTIVNLDSLGL